MQALYNDDLSKIYTERGATPETDFSLLDGSQNRFRVTIKINKNRIQR